MAKYLITQGLGVGPSLAIAFYVLFFLVPSLGAQSEYALKLLGVFSIVSFLSNGTFGINLYLVRSVSQGKLPQKFLVKFNGLFTTLFFLAVVLALCSLDFTLLSVAVIGIAVALRGILEGAEYFALSFFIKLFIGPLLIVVFIFFEGGYEIIFYLSVVFFLLALANKSVQRSQKYVSLSKVDFEFETYWPCLASFLLMSWFIFSDRVYASIIGGEFFSRTLDFEQSLKILLPINILYSFLLPRLHKINYKPTMIWALVCLSIAYAIGVSAVLAEVFNGEFGEKCILSFAILGFFLVARSVVHMTFTPSHILMFSLVLFLTDFALLSVDASLQLSAFIRFLAVGLCVGMVYRQSKYLESALK